MTAVRVGGFEPRKRNTHGHEGHPEPSAAERVTMAVLEIVDSRCPWLLRTMPEKELARFEKRLRKSVEKAISAP